MPRCSNCGRESPQGSLFCLNCGSRLAPAHGYETPQAPSELPGVKHCPECSADNPPDMNFCRNCGTRLAAREPTPVPAPAPAPAAAGAPMPSPASIVSQSQAAPRPGPGSAGPSSALGAPTQACPHCGAQTPRGFAFCQQCGRNLAAGGGVSPGTNRSPDVISGETGGAAAAGVDAVGPTMAAAEPDAMVARLRASSAAERAASPAPQAMHAPQVEPTPQATTEPWGALITIHRDGSEGERFALRGEWVAVGRDQTDIAFPDDRFLAPTHARIERAAGGARIVPLDTLNSVFWRIDEPTPLDSGDVLLLGREVMRFEVVDEDERRATPLVRHGVALFGSPPREPWGRLMQQLASGGVRDVRHLVAPVVTVGREEGDLVFRDDHFMSRRHATLSWKDGACILEDLGSSNGTYIRLYGPRSVRSGDQLRMGDQVFRFELQGGA